MRGTVIEVKTRLGANHNVVIRRDTDSTHHMTGQERPPAKRMEAARAEIQTTYTARRRYPQTLAAVDRHGTDPVITKMA